MTLKNRGRSKKTERRTRPKSRGGSLAVGTYLQRGSAPPPGVYLVQGVYPRNVMYVFVLGG